jgi:hypothetical protein
MGSEGVATPVSPESLLADPDRRCLARGECIAGGGSGS